LKSSCAARTGSGFTLIETLVVLVISVGLVTLMTTLYRSVGMAAIALAGNDKEWLFQDQLRRQLRHGFAPQGKISQPISGKAGQLLLLTWSGRQNGLAGKPVLAEYRYRPAARELAYRELDLPAWWSDMSAGALQLDRLATELNGMREQSLLTGIDGFSFSYHSNGRVAPAWNDPVDAGGPTPLVEVRFDRGVQPVKLLFRLRLSNG
jgi:prepilin-type N-terminal cleavage/methylation domain-containing protein